MAALLHIKLLVISLFICVHKTQYKLMVLSQYHCGFMIFEILPLKQTIMDTTNFPKVTPAGLTNQI